MKPNAEPPPPNGDTWALPPPPSKKPKAETSGGDGSAAAMKPKAESPTAVDGDTGALPPPPLPPAMKPKAVPLKAESDGGAIGRHGHEARGMGTDGGGMGTDGGGGAAGGGAAGGGAAGGGAAARTMIWDHVLELLETWNCWPAQRPQGIITCLMPEGVWIWCGMPPCMPAGTVTAIVCICSCRSSSLSQTVWPHAALSAAAFIASKCCEHTNTQTHGARSAPVVAIGAISEPDALLISTDCD